MSLEDDFDIHATWGIGSPCFIRKVPRPSCCGDDSDPSEERALKIKDSVLSEGDGVLSVFYVENSRDVARAALALNWRRNAGSKIYELALIAFSVDELSSIAKNQTADEFICYWAKRNHWDITLTPDDQASIATALAQKNRFPKFFNKNKLKRASEVLKGEGCRSVSVGSSHCDCESEMSA